MSLRLGHEQVNSVIGGGGALDMVHPVDLDAFLYKQ